MDRQDIDALLIGALYGELTPADEAKLTAHLDSHPADRSALDDLKQARQAVLDSRIFVAQLEPPQAISALLLQEAHRRAPKRPAVSEDEDRESWFYRFTRAFMAHPAMAAAAMLVLVLGGAGIVYMKKGDQFAAKEVAAPSSAAPAQQPAPAGPADTVAVEGAAGSGYNAGLYEPEAAEPNAADRWAADGAKLDELDEQRQNAVVDQRKRNASATRGIAVATDKGEVKELERAKAGKSDAELGGESKDRIGGTAGDDRDASPPAEQGFAPPPPPAAAASSPGGATASNRAGGATATARPETTAPRAPEKKAMTVAKPSPEAKPTDKAEPKREESSLTAWAKGEHSRAVGLAQKGDCSGAAKVALAVSTRASDYYTQFMATDRALKQCAAYINAERDRDAERSGKARAQKRVNADEPASRK